MADVKSGALQVVFVNADLAGDDGDGTSWATAFRGRLTLQNALASLNGKPAQLWVAKGSYAPALPGGSRDLSILVPDGVQVFGGFAGGEVSLDERDPTINVTIITGDLNGDDPPGDLPFGAASSPPTVGDNSRHVMRMVNAGPSTIVDGFTIERGHSDEEGGRGSNVIIDGGEPQLNNCRIAHGLTWDGAGGALIRAAEPILRHCSFIDNHADIGGGVLHTDGSAASFEDCLFTRNRGNGAGVFNGRASHVDPPLVCRPVLHRCHFVANGGGAAFGIGSGIGFFDRGGQPIFEDCLFQDNATVAGGGGMMLIRSGAVVRNSTFINNEGASDGGGALYITTGAFFPGEPEPIVGHPVFVNCIMNGNNGVLVCIGDDALVELINCTVAHNTREPWWQSWPAFLVSQGGSMRLANTVVWGHTPLPMEINGEWVIDSGLAGVLMGDGQIVADHCRVELWDGTRPGTGTNDANPRYIDPLGADQLAGTLDDDLRVGSGSPCIDAGDNAVVPKHVTTDIAGLARFVDIGLIPDRGNGTAPIVDIGAHERQFCDLNGDGVMNVADLLMVIGNWGTADPVTDMTGNGVVNVADLLAVIQAWGACLP